MGFFMTLLLTIFIVMGMTDTPITILWIYYVLSFFF